MGNGEEEEKRNAGEEKDSPRSGLLSADPTSRPPNMGEGEWCGGVWLYGCGFEVHGFGHGEAHFCGGEGDFYACFSQRFDFGVGGACWFAACARGDDGAGVAHAFAGGGGASCDEGGDRFGDMVLDISSRVFFVFATDFADHKDGVGVGVRFEHAEAVDVVDASYGVASDADAGGLGEADL